MEKSELVDVFEKCMSDREYYDQVTQAFQGHTSPLPLQGARGAAFVSFVLAQLYQGVSCWEDFYGTASWPVISPVDTTKKAKTEPEAFPALGKPKRRIHVQMDNGNHIKSGNQNKTAQVVAKPNPWAPSVLGTHESVSNRERKALLAAKTQTHPKRNRSRSKNEPLKPPPKREPPPKNAWVKHAPEKWILKHAHESSVVLEPLPIAKSKSKSKSHPLVRLANLHALWIRQSFVPMIESFGFLLRLLGLNPLAFVQGDCVGTLSLFQEFQKGLVCVQYAHAVLCLTVQEWCAFGKETVRRILSFPSVALVEAGLEHSKKPGKPKKPNLRLHELVQDHSTRPTDVVSVEKRLYGNGFYVPLYVMSTLLFDQATDSKFAFGKSQLGVFSNREKARDELGEIVRGGLLKETMKKPEFQRQFRELVERLCPENRLWFARLFVAQMLEKCTSGIGGEQEIHIHEGGGDKMLRDKIHRLALRTLGEGKGVDGRDLISSSLNNLSNLSTASNVGSGSGLVNAGSVKRKKNEVDFVAIHSFSEKQECFFSDLLAASTNAQFHNAVRFSLQAVIGDLRSAPLSSEFDFVHRIIQLKLVSHFLGWLVFSLGSLLHPFASTSGTTPAFLVQERKVCELIVEGEAVFGQDSSTIVNIVKNAAENKQLGVTIPWVCAFLLWMYKSKAYRETVGLEECCVVLAEIYTQLKCVGVDDVGGGIVETKGGGAQTDESGERHPKPRIDLSESLRVYVLLELDGFFDAMGKSARSVLLYNVKERRKELSVMLWDQVDPSLRDDVVHQCVGDTFLQYTSRAWRMMSVLSLTKKREPKLDRRITPLVQGNDSDEEKEKEKEKGKTKTNQEPFAAEFTSPRVLFYAQHKMRFWFSSQYPSLSRLAETICDHVIAQALEHLREQWFVSEAPSLEQALSMARNWCRVPIHRSLELLAPLSVPDKVLQLATSLTIQRACMLLELRVPEWVGVLEKMGDGGEGKESRGMRSEASVGVRTKVDGMSVESVKNSHANANTARAGQPNAPLENKNPPQSKSERWVYVLGSVGDVNHVMPLLVSALEQSADLWPELDLALCRGELSPRVLVVVCEWLTQKVEVPRLALAHTIAHLWKTEPSDAVAEMARVCGFGMVS